MANSKKKNVKEMSYAELVAERNDMKQKYMDLRFQMVVGHVDNPMQKRTIRREIARLNTLIHQQDLENFRKAAAEAIYKLATDKDYAKRLTDEGKKQLLTFDNYEQRTEKLIRILESLSERNAAII